ncbi:MAG: 30S ribosomal protein S11 [Alphaproteobacteria bacterium]|nr:MAG: 30S ribosomal protein S11 [Alphaproteobacteria bacterium]
MAVAGKKNIRKKKGLVERAIVSIHSTFNNTIITIANERGDVIASSSAGACGFKGSKKSTPFAAQVASENAATKAKEYGVKTCSVQLTGPGSGREMAVRALMSAGFVLTSIRDVTPIPHNGCRAPKRRRV